MKFILTLYLILIQSAVCLGQKLLLPNEKCVFSFKTNNGKTVMLAMDKQMKYILYRYGTDGKVEFEFPTKNMESWKKFKYNYYFRGGGKQNAGVDIDNLKFENNGFEYVIFMNYDAGDDEHEESMSVGINIHNLKTKKITTIKGKSIINSLQGFRTNGLLQIDEDMGLELE